MSGRCRHEKNANFILKHFKAEKITLSRGGVVSQLRGGGSLPPLGGCKNITDQRARG